MTLYAEVPALYTYLATVPITPENTALLTALITRASATVDEHLPGVDPLALVPVPASLEQVTLELAASMYRSQDQGKGAAPLTSDQIATIRQIRIRTGTVPV